MDQNSFSGRLQLLIDACRALDDFALADATWEPHDWSDFD